MDSEIKDLILTMKAKSKSRMGYELQDGCEALVSHILTEFELPTSILKLCSDPETNYKNDEISVEYREQGNKCFVAGDDLAAITWYTKSLAYAKSSENMAYAHANRSAVLYRKQLYKECLVDIKMALELDYPEEKRSKLEERRSKTMAILATAPTPTQTCHGNIKNNAEMKSFPYGPSKEVPTNSHGIQISYSEKFGRHLIATEEFKPGDILTMEKAFYWTLDNDKLYTHCYHCLEPTYTLIPCPDCPISLYCSEKCREADWNCAHKFECTCLSTLMVAQYESVEMHSVRRTIRMLMALTCSGEKIQELKQDLKFAATNSDYRTAGFNEDGILDSSRPISVLSLATNMITRPLSGIYKFAHISALITILLITQTTFFGKKFEWNEFMNINKYPDIKFCAGLILRTRIISTCNCFSIDAERGKKSATALYTTHSLYNHSCVPNTFFHVEGLTLITRAMQRILPGDQIFISYSRCYRMSLAEKKNYFLNKYFFECSCPACLNDWPSDQEILKNLLSFIPTRKIVAQRLRPYQKRFVANEDDIEAIKEVLRILDEEKVRMPCADLLHATEFLQNFYWRKTH